MNENTDVKNLNRLLRYNYGTDARGRANYRIVWSEEAYEKRLGTFLGSDYPEVREVRKYSKSIADHMWVLERLVFQPNPELPESVNGHYEPRWVYRDAEGNPLQLPSYQVVAFLADCDRQGIRATLAEREEEEKKADAARRLAIRDEIENAAQAGSGEQIGYSGKELVE